jgi:DNA-binding beta-propeller fold protein YncE
MLKFRPSLTAATLAMLACAIPAVCGQKAGAAPVQGTNEQLVWPAPPTPARIKWVSEYRTEFDIGAKKRRSFIDRLAGKNEDVIRLRRPIAVAVDEKGTVFVADFGQGVVALDPNGKRMWRFSSVSGVALSSPAGIAADSKFVYATDTSTNTLTVFDKEGHRLTGLGPSDGLKRPVGVAVDETRDLVLVVNAGEHTVLLLNRALKLQKKIGERGSNPGQFNFPTFAAFIPGGGFAITDTGNFRVQIFDANGKFVRAFGKAGDVSGNFSRPKGIALDPDGNLYVVDAVFSNFQIFRLDGQLLTFVGRGGATKGMFQVPSGIAIGKDGAIYVADEMNGRIQRFQYISLPTPQATVAKPATH